MAPSLAARILGCGSSAGVPRIGNDWGQCDPANPRNRRRRCSLLVERREFSRVTRVLIDTSPDLREQLLDADCDSLDAVLYTHEHADHTHGIDDLRPLAMLSRRRIVVHMDARTSEIMHRRFGYCFETPPGSPYPPILDEARITPPHPIAVAGPGGTIIAQPFTQVHGPIASLGFRFGGLAYSCDLSDLPDESLAYLTDLDVWIVDALRRTPHISHFTLDDALRWIERIRPRRAILTNLHVDLDYETLRRELPDNVEPAHDGLTVAIDAAPAEPADANA